jgi:hypothetical protein
MVELGIVEKEEADDKSQYYDALKQSLEQKLKLNQVNYIECLSEALSINKSLQVQFSKGIWQANF